MNWQPIETAPKDGEWIVLLGRCYRTQASAMVCQWVHGGWASSDDGYPGYISDVTHWMPLPEPPK